MSGNSHPITNMMAALETALQSMSIQDLPRLRGELKRIDAMAELRMLTGPRHEERETTGKTNLVAQDVAGILNVKPSMVYELVRTNRLKAYKVGKYIRFLESDIQDFLAQGGA